jgi:signal transduction histidine kinase
VSALAWSLAAVQSGVAVAAVLALRRRTALAARVGHEVRGPLCTALLGLERLAAAGDPATLTAVELELRRAALALDDLQARPVSARGSGEPVDVGALLAAATPGWSALAAAHGAALAVDAPAGLIVRGERLRLAQACGNLVANAVEHGGGSVAVRARAAGVAVRVEVTDTGCGLPAPVEVLVGGARGARGRRGHGLAVAAEVARRHGGRLAAGPSAQGARLVLEIPAVAVPRRRAAP